MSSFLLEDAIARDNATSPGILLSISVGFAFSAEGKKPLAELFKKADNNMYREKFGRGRSTRARMESETESVDHL